MEKSNTTYMSGHRERRQSSASFRYGTFEKYLEAQQQYAWLFQHAIWSIKFQDMVDAIKEGRAIAISDGSHKNKWGTKQRMLQNLNDIECPIDIVTGSAEDMYAATVTIRDIFYQYKDDEGGQLSDAIEQTNKCRTYIFLFHQSKIEIVDNMINNLYAKLDAFGAWDDCDLYFRYLTLLPINVLGRVVKSTPTDFWANHLAAFKPNGIPAEIDTQELQYSTKKRATWVRAFYSDAAKGRNSVSNTSPTVANTSDQGQDNNST
jgi:hypothetical protein